METRSTGIRPGTPGTIALALSLLVVGACGGSGEAARNSASDSPPPGLAAEPSPETVPPVAVLKPLAPEEILEPPAAPEKILEPPAAPARTSARRTVNDDPDQLIGLAPQAISRLLGPPSLLRTETPAQVWQYTAADCVLDIYLYAEAEKPDRSRVTYYEIRAAEPARRGARACFADIIGRRNLAAGTTPES